MTFLTIDVGNSRLKWGIYEQASPGAALLHHGVVPLESIESLYEHAWMHLSRPQAMLGCVVAGESVRRRIESELLPWGVTPAWVTAQAHAAGIQNHYEHPNQLGADRWLAMVGARSRLLSMSDVTPPAVVVMVGTAVTVDALDEQGRFLGGLILPGFGLMSRALELGTAGLKVPEGEWVPFPKNTSDALMSGAAEAIAGAVLRMSDRLMHACGQSPVLILSGGAVSKLTAALNGHAEPCLFEYLIFEGLLRVAHETACESR